MDVKQINNEFIEYNKDLADKITEEGKKVMKKTENVVIDGETLTVIESTYYNGKSAEILE